MIKLALSPKGKILEINTNIEEFLNDYDNQEEFNCDDNINYLEDAIQLLIKSNKIFKALYKSLQ